MSNLALHTGYTDGCFCLRMHVILERKYETWGKLLCQPMVTMMHVHSLPLTLAEVFVKQRLYAGEWDVKAGVLSLSHHDY